MGDLKERGGGPAGEEAESDRFFRDWVRSLSLFVAGPPARLLAREGDVGNDAIVEVRGFASGRRAAIVSFSADASVGWSQVQQAFFDRNKG